MENLLKRMSLVEVFTLIGIFYCFGVEACNSFERRELEQIQEKI